MAWVGAILVVGVLLEAVSCYPLTPLRPPLKAKQRSATISKCVSNSGAASGFNSWLQEQRTQAAESAATGEASIYVIDAGSDVDNSFTFSGVAWKVLADVSTNSFGAGDVKVVVNFPGFSLGSEIFEVFSSLFTSAQQADKKLVELDRLEVEAPPVAGPALVITARARTEVESALALRRRDASLAAVANEVACVEAVKAFVDRVVVGEPGENKGACPYTESTKVAATGLGKQGVQPGPVGYRYDPGSDVLDCMAACWQAFAEVCRPSNSATAIEPHSIITALGRKARGRVFHT